ncbi:MAG: Uma2 family endonuclease [Planctomycetes bacterium]|nr:Uma2 family endonuclease [Planctomycetota bacterium]
MATVLKIGPTDRGRPMTLEEFLAGDYEGGYHYELIDGKLYVSPAANFPEDRVEKWLLFKLELYSHEHPEVVNYVTDKARIFVPGRPRITAPEPDLAAFHDVPLERPSREIRWQAMSPLLVGEVLSAEDPDKDLVRNVALYLQVPAIKEYWVLDSRDDPDHPLVTVYRRRGRQWRKIEVAPGATYTTKLLPGFELVLNPRL